MATEILTDSETNSDAITAYYTDERWELRDGALPPGVLRRLAAVDRSLHASSHIAELLVRDARGKRDARENDGVAYAGLSATDAEALEVAMIELNSRATERMEEVRESAHGCCDRK